MYVVYFILFFGFSTHPTLTHFDTLAQCYYKYLYKHIYEHADRKSFATLKLERINKFHISIHRTVPNDKISSC